MAVLIHELKARNVDFKICVTAQHREMLDQALDFFEIKPDYDLDLMKNAQSLNSLSSAILASVDEILDEFKPDMVLVHGDTTTTFVTALASFQKGIRVGHVEAGLRTYDKRAPFPEELNRQLTARVSDFHYAPTQIAKDNLLSERIPDENILVTGNTIIDSLKWGLKKIETYTSPELAELKSFLDDNKKLILVTGHRRENFNGGINRICKALKILAGNENIQIIFPVHLNPRILEVVKKELNGIGNIILTAPVSYPTMIWLMQRCGLIISDSGGIQEEAPTFQKPVLVTRELSERKEGINSGFSFLVGTNVELIVNKAQELLADPIELNVLENPYGDGKASSRIVEHLMGISMR